MDGLGEDLELVALVARLLQQIGGGGLSAEEQALQLGLLARVAMAVSMPFMPVMMTSVMSMSGWKLSRASMAASPL